MNAFPMQKPQPEPVPSHKPDPVQHVLQITTAYFLSSVLWAIAELNIADLLKDGPRPVSELARARSVKEDPLYRSLRLLAMAGIFTETGPRTFALTPAANVLRTDVPDSVRDMALFLADPLHFHVASEWLHSVKTGQPTIEHLTGKPAFEYFASQPAEFDRFHRAMTSISNMVIGPVLEAYDFSPFTTVVDVAGGHGFILCEILKRYPKLKGILFDMSEVVPGAEERIQNCGLEGRCSAVAGDFFKAVPAGGDLYLMKNIIHDWDDDKALTILRNCRQALESKPNDKVVLLEVVVPSGNEPHFAKVLDIEMLFFPGGRERTESEFAALFARAGLRLARIVPTKSPFSVIEAEVAQ